MRKSSACSLSSAKIVIARVVPVCESIRACACACVCVCAKCAITMTLSNNNRTLPSHCCMPTTTAPPILGRHERSTSLLGVQHFLSRCSCVHRKSLSSFVGEMDCHGGCTNCARRCHPSHKLTRPLTHPLNSLAQLSHIDSLHQLFCTGIPYSLSPSNSRTCAAPLTSCTVGCQ